MIAVAMRQPYRLTRSIPQKIQLCASDLAASYRADVKDIRRVQREDSLDTLVAHHPADREGLVDPTAFAGDHSTRKNLRAFLVTLFYPAANVNRIAYFETRYIFLEAPGLDCIQQFSFHFYIS